jgi:hypothetical protein
MHGEFGPEAARFDPASVGEPAAGDRSADAQLPALASAASRAAEKSQGVAKIVSSAPGRLEVVTMSASPGFLVVHDLYYPGWVAAVD